MRKIFVFAAILSGAITGLAAQELPAERIVVPLGRPEKGGTLIIKHDKGSISVRGTQGTAVIVEAFWRRNAGLDDGDQEARGMTLIAGRKTGLRAVETDGTVTISSDGRGRTLDLVVTVPRTFSLKLSTVHNGGIDVENVSGEMEISNNNGDIRLDGVSGSAVLNTFDGRITARFVGVFPDVPMAFSSVYGKIDVAFPADVRMTVRMKTDNGLIYSDFDLKTDRLAGRRRESPTRGEQRLSSEDWTVGDINGGGAETLLKSFDGNIYLRKTK
jgi:hypothetical protein